MAIKKTNKAGHVFGGHIGGVDYFRQDDGRWTDSGAVLVEPGYAKILDQFFPKEIEDENTPPPPKKKRKREPVIEPEEEDKPKKKGKKKKEEPKEKTTRAGRLGKAALKTLFPGPYEAAETLSGLWKGDKEDENQPGRTARLGKAAFEGIFPGIAKTASSAKKLWTGDEEPEDKTKSKKKNKKKDKEEQVDLSEQKRQAAEKRFQYNRVEDSLKDNADLLRDVISIQERSSDILSQIASSIGKMDGGGPDIPGLGGGGGGSGGNKGPKPKGKGFSRKTKMIAGGLAAAAVAGGVAYSLSDNKDEEVDMSPSSESPPPAAAEVQGPPAPPPPQAAPVSKPSVAPKPLNRAQKALTGNIGSEENTKRQAELSSEYSDAKKAEDDTKKEMMDFEKEQKKSGAKTKQVASKWGDWDEQYEDPEIQKKSKELKSKAYEASKKTQAVQSEAENRGAYGENKLDEDVFGHGERSKLDTSNDLPAVIDALKRDFGMTNEQIAKIGGGTLTSSVEGDEKTAPGKRTTQSFTFKNSRAVLDLYKKKVKEKLEGKVTVPVPPDTSEEAAPKPDAEAQEPSAPSQDTSPQAEVQGPPAPPAAESQAVPVSKPEPTSKKISGVGNEKEDKIFQQLMEESGNPTDLDSQKDLRDEAGMRLKANKVSGALGQTPLTGNGSQSASGVLQEGKVVSATGQSLAEKAETSGIEEARNRGPQATSTPEIISYKADQIKFNADKLTFEVQSLNVEMKQAAGQQAAASGGASGEGTGGTPSAGGTGSGGASGGGGAGTAGGEAPGAGAGAPGGGPQAAQTGAPSVAGPAAGGGGGAPSQGGPGVSSTDASAPTYKPGGGRNVPQAAPEATRERAPSAAGGEPGSAGTPHTGLGSISAKYESGGKGVNTVSSGRGDPGGVSYGAHQLASKTGTMAKYLASPEGKQYASEFQGKAPGSPEFNEAYKKVASQDPAGFSDSQKNFITRTHYNPVADSAKKMGYDTTNPKVQEALYSMGVQHGGAKKIVAAAGNMEGKSPDEQVRALYAARSQYVDNLGMGNLKTRYKQELKDVLAMSDKPAGEKVDNKVKEAVKEEKKKEEKTESAGANAVPAGQEQQDQNSAVASNQNPSPPTPPAPSPEDAKKLEAQTENPAAKEKVAEAATPGTEQTRAAEQLSAPPVVIAAGGQPTTPPVGSGRGSGASELEQRRADAAPVVNSPESTEEWKKLSKPEKVALLTIDKKFGGSGKDIASILSRKESESYGSELERANKRFEGDKSFGNFGTVPKELIEQSEGRINDYAAAMKEKDPEKRKQMMDAYHEQQQTAQQKLSEAISNSQPTEEWTQEASDKARESFSNKKRIDAVPEAAAIASETPAATTETTNVASLEAPAPAAPAEDINPPAEPEAAPAAPAQSAGGETQQAAAEKPDDKPSATGGEFIGKLSRTLPYLSMAVVTGQQQALHSVNQHLQARR
jgi:hypothetical protein